MGPALKEAIATIDELIAQLSSGAFVGTGAAPAAPKPAAPAPAAPTPETKAAKPAKASKPAKQAKPAAAPAGGAAEGPDLFARAHIAVARVASAVAHPNSDKLYVTQLDLGAGGTRQVVAGLQQYVPREELEGALVAVVLNLKPAKLGGELSQGMILAASEVGGGRVRPLAPPPGSAPGEAVRLAGRAPPPPDSYPKALKSEHWRKIAAGLAVAGGAAAFEGAALETEAGPVAAPGFPDGSTIS